MTKKFRQFSDDMYDDTETHRTSVKEIMEHRRNKRLKNALRARNINNILSDLDEDYDED